MAVFALAYGREAEDLKFYYTNYDSIPGYYVNAYIYIPLQQSVEQKNG